MNLGVIPFEFSICSTYSCINTLNNQLKLGLIEVMLAQCPYSDQKYFSYTHLLLTLYQTFVKSSDYFLKHYSLVDKATARIPKYPFVELFLFEYGLSSQQAFFLFSTTFSIINSANSLLSIFF